MQKKENNSSLGDDPIENDLHLELTRLCNGLSYMSETDAPIAVFIGQKAGEISREEILRQTGLTDSEAIEEITTEAFFEKLTTVREWYNTEQVVNTERYGELKKYLQDSLTHTHVFRIGRIQVNIFVIGLDPAGRVVGIKTMAVET